MKARQGVVLAVAVLVALLAGWGCESPSQEPGVVARVNGQPIMLRQLEFKYDLKHMDVVSAPASTVEDLRREYGEILGGLIIQELVVQALEKRGMSVTDEELAEAEKEVRADYPDGAFDQILIEEYIDLAAWREQLRYRLALDKLFRQVLRPRIALDYKEAEKYYREHIRDFHQPERWTLFVLTGPDPRELRKACDMKKPQNNIRMLTARYPEIIPRSITIQKEKLPDAWREALEEVGRDEPTEVLQGHTGFECLRLLEMFPARTLDPMEAYPLVEKILIEQKLQKAFNEWLEQALASARIEVADRLREQASASASAPAEPDAGEGSQ